MTTRTIHFLIPRSKIRFAHEILNAQAIGTALERNAFNRLAAAKEISIYNNTLFLRMKKLEIPLPEQDGCANRKKIG